jgi:hypothetical protein
MTKQKHLSPTRVLRRVAAVMLLLGAVAIVAVAQSPNSNTNSSKTKKYVATKEIVFDQATKTLRKPSAAETDAMVAQISKITDRSTDGLTGRMLANGTKQVHLQGRFGGIALGRANADGTTEVRCVTSMAEAVEFLGLAEVQ